MEVDPCSIKKLQKRKERAFIARIPKELCIFMGKSGLAWLIRVVTKFEYRMVEERRALSSFSYE